MAMQGAEGNSRVPGRTCHPYWLFLYYAHPHPHSCRGDHRTQFGQLVASESDVFHLETEAFNWGANDFSAFPPAMATREACAEEEEPAD